MATITSCGQSIDIYFFPRSHPHTFSWMTNRSFERHSHPHSSFLKVRNPYLKACKDGGEECHSRLPKMVVPSGGYAIQEVLLPLLTNLEKGEVLEYMEWK